MPIQFPKPTGPTRSYIEGQWWKNRAKAFNVIPAPSMARPGVLFGQNCPYSGQSGWSLAPGKGLHEWRAVNLRNLNSMYDGTVGRSVVNPARRAFAVSDDISGNDRVLGTQNERIIGVSRDSTGVSLGSCTVKIFRTADDVCVASTVSDGSGNWTAYPNQEGPYYFVEYKAGSPDVFGTSPNTNTYTTFTPGA
jgi:hypothetical protein